MAPSYNVTMTEVQAASGAQFGIAGVFVDALAAHDFDGLAAALDPDATMSALLPRGFVEWHGAGEICAAFAKWFGNVDEFEVADAAIGQVGALLQLRWRVRLQGERFGAEPMIVEQYAYATCGANARIDRIRLLCSGFWNEHATA
jgi:hypothetical protein